MKTRAAFISNRALVMVAGGCLSLIPAMRAHADFNYTNFASTSGINLVGTSVQNANSIQLTQTAVGQAGAMWVQDKQDVSQAFEATMTIHIENKQGGGADGFALVIQNQSATALGASGGGMGYARNQTFNVAGISNSLAVELDTWNNDASDWVDGATPHVSIQTNGTGQNMADAGHSLGGLQLSPLGLTTHTIRVSYVPGTMSIYVDGAATPAVVSAVNLSSLLSLDNGKAWIGVTAGTGAPQDAQTHVVDALSFVSTNIPAPGAGALAACGLVMAGRRRRMSK